jgi:zinc D-Ala-D-Ala dipeptidase
MSYPNYEISILDPSRFAGSYRRAPVDRNDVRYLEPLARLEDYDIAFESYYARSDGGNQPFCCRIEGSRDDVWLRRTLAEKLAAANERLRSFGAELFVFDGYRPVECQRGLWEFYLAKARRELVKPSDSDCRAYASEFVADPSAFDELDSRTWLAHMTGAAADLTLRDVTSGKLLEMGSRFEDYSPVSNNDYFERQLAAGSIRADDVRLQNRRLLNWALTEEGVLNQTTGVYWHYDWGNQPYVRTSRVLLPAAPIAAWYGYIKHLA